jgi:hypothetical protein
MSKYKRSGRDMVSFLLGFGSVLIIAFFVIRYILQNLAMLLPSFGICFRPLG